MPRVDGKGGLPNAAVRGRGRRGATGRPRGRADEVLIVLPWGSLLRGALALDERRGGGHRRAARAGRPRPRIVSITDRDAATTDLRPLDGRGRARAIARRWSGHGLTLTCFEPATAEAIAATGSTWGRRLTAGSRRGADRRACNRRTTGLGRSSSGAIRAAEDGRARIRGSCPRRRSAACLASPRRASRRPRCVRAHRRAGLRCARRRARERHRRRRRDARFRVDLARPGDFVAQANFVQCVGASMQMMLNISGPNDRTAATQRRLQGLARNLSGPTPAGFVRNGASVRGWSAGLNELGAGPYRLVGVTTIDEAMRLAATSIRTTGKPVGLLVWAGRHAWVMSGFEATADPRPDLALPGDAGDRHGSALPVRLDEVGPRARGHARRSRPRHSASSSCRAGAGRGRAP